MEELKEMTSVELVIYYASLELRHKYGISDEEWKFINNTQHAILREIERRTGERP